MSCELPRDSLSKNSSSCHPREGGRGEGGVGKCWDYRVTSAHHNIHAGAGSVPRCQVTPQLWCSIQSHSSLAGSCLQVLTLLSSSWGRDASFDLLRDLCRAKHLACPSHASGTLTSPPWAHRKCIQRRKCLCWNSLHPLPSRGKRAPVWPFHICHSPWSETLITEANCKTSGLLCPSPLFVALHYNDYRLTSMNCTSSKRWAAMLYNIVSHKANTEISNCLIFYLKKIL